MSWSSHPTAVHGLFCPYQAKRLPLKRNPPSVYPQAFLIFSAWMIFCADKCEKTMQKFMNLVKHIFPITTLERKNLSRITVSRDVWFGERESFFSFDGSSVC